MAKGPIIIMVTCASRKEARKIADSLLIKRLVACANIVSGIESKFWWEGKINSASETLLMMKTVKANFKKVEAVVLNLHSYEVPAIIAAPIAAGSSSCFNWIEKSVRI